jgi:hypothetical protein
MTLQAKIFGKGTAAIAGQTITTAQLAEAVTAFNGNAHSGLVTFDDYPGTMNASAERIAATARLHMENECVIATIKFLDTPMGLTAASLFDSGTPLHIMPVTSAAPTPTELKLQIRHLVIPANPATFFVENTPLKKVQSWVNGDTEDFRPMFELKEHK